MAVFASKTHIAIHNRIFADARINIRVAVLLGQEIEGIVVLFRKRGCLQFVAWLGLGEISGFGWNKHGTNYEKPTVSLKTKERVNTFNQSSTIHNVQICQNHLKSLPRCQSVASLLKPLSSILPNVGRGVAVGNFDTESYQMYAVTTYSG